jgi:hypothetical protein
VSGFDLTASIIGSIAWPLVILVLIVALRAQIKRAAEAIVKRIADITEVTAPGVSVKLEKQINELAERTEALPDSPPEGDNVIVRPSPANLELRAGTPIITVTSDDAEAQQQVTKYQRLAAENPKAAVLTAFSDLEVVLRNWYERNLGAQGRYVSFGKIIDGLQRTGVLDESVGRALRDISEIRNKIAHSDATVNQAMADAYIESIGNLLGYMILFNKSADAQQESSEDQSEETDKDDSGGSTPAGS